MYIKEGNNRMLSVYLKSLVNKHNKAGNTCRTQENKDTREYPNV